MQRGRLDDAHQLFAFAATDFALPMSPGAWLTALSLYSQVAVACRDRTIAAGLVDQLTPLTDQMGSVGAGNFSPVSHRIGQLDTVLGRYDQAEVSFASADELTRRAGARCFTAENDLAWARMLIERRCPGDVEQARQRLHRSQRDRRTPRLHPRHPTGHCRARHAALTAVLAARSGSTASSASSGAPRHLDNGLTNREILELMPRTSAVRFATIAVAALLGAAACGGAEQTSRDTTAAATSDQGAGPLSFTAQVLGGDQLEGASLAGQAVMLWFWAPT